MNELEAACLSHDQCHSWKSGNWVSGRMTCDWNQKLNSLKICDNLKGLQFSKNDHKRKQCHKERIAKFVVLQTPVSHYHKAQKEGCGP